MEAAMYPGRPKHSNTDKRGGSKDDEFEGQFRGEEGGETWRNEWYGKGGTEQEERDGSFSSNYHEKQSERDWDRRRSRGRGDFSEEGGQNGYEGSRKSKHRMSPDYKRGYSGGPGSDKRSRDEWDRRVYYNQSPRSSYDRDDEPRQRSRDYRSQDYDRDRRGNSDREGGRRSSRGGYDRDYDDTEGGRGRYRGGRDHSPDSDSYDDYYRGSGGSGNYGGDGNRSGRNSDDYRDQAPNNTVMIKGLAQHITENDIRKDILQCNLMPRDIRLIRKKDTGASRGFAFVEFNTVGEAEQWMERKQGILILQDQYKAEMYYSIPKEPGFERGVIKSQDWYCVKCGAHNFKRRDVCFKCSASRKESEEGGEGSDEVSPHPTHTVLLRNLDVLSTEEAVLQAIKGLSSAAIRSIRMGRDSLTNTSRGVCYIELNSVMDSVSLHNALNGGRLVVDGRKALVSYCKLPSQQTSAAERAGLPTGGYGPEDIPRLAEYSASMYATSPEEHAAYLSYYTQYYEAQIAAQASVSAPPSATPGTSQTQTDSVNAAAAVALSAIQQVQAAKEIKKHAEDPQEMKRKIAAGVYPAIAGANSLPYIGAAGAVAKYSVPDVSTYQYDESSGYYYDASTGLYYDATSQYYYNPQTQQFLYWDQERQTYMPTPQSGVTPSAPSTTEDASNPNDSGKKQKDNKQDKVKVAKKIAKDMERWAKTLNQKKDNPQANSAAAMAAASISSGKSVGAADAGYAILERKERSLDAQVSSLMREEELSPKAGASTTPVLPAGGPGGLVAAYGGGSDSDEDIDDVLQEERLHTNWARLACLLCKRQFPNRESLSRHQQLSDLHRQNLEAWYRVRGLDQNDPQQRNSKYRDRAKERRSKFGAPNPPYRNRLKENFLKAREEAASTVYEEPTKAGIGSENVGNRLLQKMGWQEGMGLGKANQGRTSIIQAEVRSSTAGLGTREAASVPILPGEKYKDRVKKMMFARYQELTEQEHGNTDPS